MGAQGGGGFVLSKSEAAVTQTDLSANIDYLLLRNSSMLL